jgi:glycosyltransferase involved in cell wall biosynthesis
MSAPANVLHVIPELETGGAERIVVELAAATVEAGGRAYVASEGGALLGELEARGGISIGFDAGTKNPLKWARNADKLIELAERYQLDVVHIHSRAPAWSGVIAKNRGLKAGFVTTHHGTYGAGNPLKRAYNSGIVRGDAVIAHSSFIADLVHHRHPFAAGRLKIIPAGIDIAKFNPASVSPDRVAALRAGWGILPEQRVILQAARLTAWKGQKVLIEALGLMQQPNVVVILAGDAQGREDYAAALDAKVAEAGLDGLVRRVGSVDDIEAAYCAADIAAFPSTQAEAFGLAVVEAQAMGVPVVVSDHGAPVETVLTGELDRTGWRVLPNDARALANGLVSALDMSADKRAAMAARARAHVIENYSLSAMNAAHLALYEALSGAR